MVEVTDRDAWSGGPREMRWLLRRQRKLAIRAYDNWQTRLDEQTPSLSLENRRRAMLAAAYLATAVTWMLIWAPLVFVASVFLDMDRTVSVVLYTVAAIPVVMFAIRYLQSLRTYPRLPGRRTRTK